jgi:signal transduction histidine kinase
LNLFDNAVYWLHSKQGGKRQIEVLLDGDENVLVFSDNGPGVKPEDAPYIFEPFYSGRGEDGRGLGLYIARQLLVRHDYGIELADTKRHRIQSGANFVVSFVKAEE